MMIIGFWNHQFTHVPIPVAALQHNKIDPTGRISSRVLASTRLSAAMS